MTVRMKPITPYQEGQNTSNHMPEPKMAKVKANMSAVRNSGNEDGLHAALMTRGMPLLPSDNHVWTHTTKVEPVGAHYSPSGEFGKRQATGMGKNGYNYGGAPNRKGDNPLGSNSNRKGGNPLGNNSERKGTNALGKAMNRVGTNAIGKNSNRMGQQSGYPKFSPKGGGKNV